MPKRQQNSNKGTFGKVLNFAGSKNYIGAAYLSTISALKIGAGLIALCSEKSIIDKVSIMLPEAVYLNHKEGFKQLEKYTVISIGSGLGTTSHAKNILKSVINKLNTKTIPLIIDADGLNILSSNNWKLPQNTIITPHPLEAARLLNTNLENVVNDLENTAKNLVKKYNCIVILKSHRTVICDLDLKIHINKNGNSALAKAGSGDVLVGVLSGLIAQKMSMFEAAKVAVYLHSRAGEIASKELSEYSVLATDIINFLPNAIREIL